MTLCGHETWVMYIYKLVVMMLQVCNVCSFIIRSPQRGGGQDEAIVCVVSSPGPPQRGPQDETIACMHLRSSKTKLGGFLVLSWSWVLFVAVRALFSFLLHFLCCYVPN